FGAQVGTNVHVVPEVEFRVGAAYYDFTNVQGQLSSPCLANSANVVCSTDLTRPSFAQKGNTYMAIRNLLVDPARPLDPSFQHYGLASAFRDLALSARLDLGHFDPIHIILDGDYVRNLAWSRDDIAAKVLANPLPAGPTVGCTSTPCSQIY